MSKPRKFRGFAVIERPDGALIWGTFRPTEAAAQAVYDSWNPIINGAERTGRIVRVDIEVFDNETSRGL